MTETNKKNFRNTILFYYGYIFCSKFIVQRGIFVLFLIHNKMSGAQIGLLQASLFWANVLSEIPTGIFGDKYGRKLSIIIGLMLMVLNGVGMILFDNFLPFLTLFILEGLAFAFVSGADEALIYDFIVRHRTSATYMRVQGIAKGLGSFSLGLAMLAGGYIKGFSWNAVYLTYSANILLAAFMLSFVPETPAMTPKKNCLYPAVEMGMRKTHAAFWKNPTARHLLIFIVAIAFYDTAITPYYVFAQDLFQSNGISITTIGLIYCVVEWLSGCGYFLAAHFPQKLNPYKTMLLVMFSSSILLVCNIFVTRHLYILLFVLVMILPSSMSVIAHQLIHDKTPSPIRATILSLLSFSESLFIGGAYIVFGFLIDHVPLYHIIGASCFVPIIAAILVCWFFQLKKRSEEKNDKKQT